MDPNAQKPPNQDQTTAQQVQQTPVQQPQQPVQQPSQPVGGVQKEREPLPSATGAVSEVLKPVEQAPTLTPELREAGVETTSDTPKVPKDLQNHIQVAKESVPVVTEPTAEVILPQLPMTQVQAQATIQQQKNNTSSSLVWFATMILKLLKKQQAKPVKGEEITG